ncbi:stalk domain-containing protein [Paenibacillus sp. CC-CFT747]|nr:stalk domain-containing protein [Paenibacillus sp. CC-CFT747]
MKKLLVSMLSLLLLTVLIPQFTFAAQADIKLYFNGKQLNPEVAPRKIGDYSMVPVRIISENMGAKVSWDQAKQMVTIEKADIYMQLVINKKEAVLNSKAITLEAAPVLLAGNTLIPVRFVAERLGLLVDWDDATQSVYVKTPDPSNGGTTPTPSPTPTPTPKPGVPQITSMESVGDQIIIKASGPIKSKLMYLSNPERLVIDLPGTTFGSGIVVPGAGQMGSVDREPFHLSHSLCRERSRHLDHPRSG